MMIQLSNKSWTLFTWISLILVNVHESKIVMPIVRPSALVSKDTLVVIRNSSQPIDTRPITFYRLNNGTNSGSPSMQDAAIVKNGHMEPYDQPLLLDYVNPNNHGYILMGLGTQSTKTFKPQNLMGEIDFSRWGYDPSPQDLQTTPSIFPQSGFSATVIPKTPTQGQDPIMYVFGGWIKNGQDFTISNTFYSFNFSSNQWVDLSSTFKDVGITPLVYHTAIGLDNQYLVITGGMSEAGSSQRNGSYLSLSKTMIFNTKDSTWKILNSKSNSECSTRPIVGHSAVEYQKEVVVFGGIDSIESDSMPYSELCILNSAKWEWRTKEVMATSGKTYKDGVAWQASIAIDNLMVSFYGVNQNSSHPIITIDLDRHQMTQSIEFKGSFDIEPLPNHNEPNVPLIASLSALGGVLICLFAIIVYKYIIKRKKSHPSFESGSNKRPGSILSFKRFRHEPVDDQNNTTSAIWSDGFNTNIVLNDEIKGEKDAKTVENAPIPDSSKIFSETNMINGELFQHDEPKFSDIELMPENDEKVTVNNSESLSHAISDDTYVNTNENESCPIKITKTNEGQDTLINK